MKKRLTLFIISILKMALMQGQPIIDSANFTPLNQEKIFRNNCDYNQPFNTIASGANISWDFSSLVTLSTDSIKYVYPDTNGYVQNNCYQFPCLISPNRINFSTTTFHGTQVFSYTINGMVERGYCNSIDYIGCSETTRFPFPLTFNDSSSNVFYGNGFSNHPFPYTWTDSTVYNLKAIGYGSLTLPNATYNNVLLVYVIQKITQTDIDLCQNACIYIDSIFYWLVPNIQHPVLEIHYPSNDAYYISQIVLATNEIPSNKLITAFPNPFNLSTSLDLGSDFENANLIIYNKIGVQVKNQKINSQTTIINRDGLTSGIYFYRVTRDNTFLMVGKLIIQ